MVASGFGIFKLMVCPVIVSRIGSSLCHTKEDKLFDPKNWETYIRGCPFCMGSNWRWRSQVGIWSSVTFVNWLHSSRARTRSGQSDTSRYAIDGCHHWKPGHESARKFGMQRCPHIGIAAQQHVDMLLVVWVSSLHLCPVQEWFWHEALVTSLRLFDH